MLRSFRNVAPRPLLFSRHFTHRPRPSDPLKLRQRAFSSETHQDSLLPKPSGPHQEKEDRSGNKERGHWWRNKETRKEIYSALAALQGLAFLTGAGVFYVAERQEREKRKAELGRNITKDIEQVKTRLKFLVNELDDLKRRTQGWESLSQKDIENYIHLQKINEFEETFSYSMRMVTRYDTSLVPQVLQIEADFQNERLRRIAGLLLGHKVDVNRTKENLEDLRKCFLDIYNVLNIVGLATAANTIDRNKQTDEQRLLLEILKPNRTKSRILVDDESEIISQLYSEETNIITDKARAIIHQFRSQQLKTLKERKLAKEIDNTKLVRDEVFAGRKP